MPRIPEIAAPVLVVALAIPIVSVCAAPPAKKAATLELAVDLAELKPPGPTFRGAILNRAEDGTVLMAVPRGWLSEAHPAYYEKHAAAEAGIRNEQLAELLTRIDAWRNERKDENKLASFLGEERGRVARLQGANDDPALKSPFVIVEVPGPRIRRTVVQPPPRKQVALVAWQEGLENVETRSLADLEKELKVRGIDIAAQTVDLTDRLPPQRDSDAQWAARRALVEYEFVKAVDFQGTGDVLVRVGGDAKSPPLASLIGDLFSSQLTRELGDLLGAPAPAKKPAAGPFEKATKGAEADGVRGVRVSRVEQNLAARRVVVEEHFLARMADGTWHVVWSWTEAADASKPRPDSEARIEKDPQVKQALELVGKLGLGGDGDDAVKTAVRFGAAVMDAQKAADGRFFRFRDACMRHLDAPPFPWAGPPVAKTK